MCERVSKEGICCGRGRGRGREPLPSKRARTSRKRAKNEPTRFVILPLSNSSTRTRERVNDSHFPSHFLRLESIPLHGTPPHSHHLDFFPKDRISRLRKNIPINIESPRTNAAMALTTNVKFLDVLHKVTNCLTPPDSVNAFVSVYVLNPCACEQNCKNTASAILSQSNPSITTIDRLRIVYID